MPKTVSQSIITYFRRLSLKRKGVVVHHHTYFKGVLFRGRAVIEPYCRLNGDPAITIGKNFYMNSGCHLLGEITIGDDVMIGPKTVIWGRDHGMALGQPMRMQPHSKRPVSIGDDVWIGANVTILKGINIGDGAVVAAGAVVVRDVPSLAIVAGNPARVVKIRT